VLAAGAGYVFDRRADGWSQHFYVKSTSPAADDRFGTGVALSTDLVAIGAPGEGDTGAVYVFR
jgi:hypothetical protein